MSSIKKIIFDYNPLEGLHQKLKPKGVFVTRKLGQVWDEKGHLLVKGKPLEGSNIRILLKTFLMNGPSEAIPTGYREFLGMLDKAGLSRIKPPGILASQNKDPPAQLRKLESWSNKKWITLGKQKKSL